MQLGNILDKWVGKATESAIAAATEKPINIALSVEPNTREWLALLVGGSVAAVLLFSYLRRK